MRSMKQPDIDTEVDIVDALNCGVEELADAATKIQATFRGFITRKQMDHLKGEEKEEVTPQVEEEIDIDLTDPEVQRAAVKIQASFKGHMVRKENQQKSTSKN